jgi:hypothetical protein
MRRDPRRTHVRHTAHNGPHATHVCAQPHNNSQTNARARVRSGQLGIGSTHNRGDLAGQMGSSLLAVNLGPGTERGRGVEGLKGRAL